MVKVTVTKNCASHRYNQEYLTMLTCSICPDHFIKDGKDHCKSPRWKEISIETFGDVCLTCMGIFDLTQPCPIQKEIDRQNSPEYKATLVKEKTETEAWLSRPKILLKCCECGTTTELGIEEYQDKRRRKKYEPESYCEKCQWFTKHEWLEKTLVLARSRRVD